MEIISRVRVGDVRLRSTGPLKGPPGRFQGHLIPFEGVLENTHYSPDIPSKCSPPLEDHVQKFSEPIRPMFLHH